MDETEPVSAESRVVKSIRNSPALVWRWVKRGFGLVSALGFAQISYFRYAGAIWRRLADLSEAADVWHYFGGGPGMLMTLTTSPFFGFGLIIVGLIGIPTAYSETQGRQPGKHWTFVGWGIFVLCAILVGSAMLFQTYMTSSGMTAVQQFYVQQNIRRHLPNGTLERVRGFLAEDKILLNYPAIYIASTPDNDSPAYAMELSQILKNAGLRMQYAGYGVTNGSESGIVLLISDPKKPSNSAESMKALLEKSGIPFHISPWTDRDNWPPLPDFIIFVTRSTPIRG